MKSLKLKNLTVKFGSKTVLNSLNLDIPAGKYWLKGSNGAGKSTLLRVLSGIQRPTSGATNIIGQQDFVADSINIPPSMNIQTVFSLYKKFNRIKEDIRNHLVEELGFERYLSNKVGQLSQGNYQKLKLILGLSGNGNWLLLDEIYNGLDFESVCKINKFLKKSNRSIIIVDHSKQLPVNSFKELSILDGKICIEQ